MKTFDDIFTAAEEKAVKDLNLKEIPKELTDKANKDNKKLAQTIDAFIANLINSKGE